MSPALVSFLDIFSFHKKLVFSVQVPAGKHLLFFCDKIVLHYPDSTAPS